MTDQVHVCWVDDTSCPRCGLDIRQHAALCQCWECHEESLHESADALGY